jgi:hypothetical protein
LHTDLKEHRELIEVMLKRIQTAGGIIVAAALGAALFFGYTTDKSITETSDRISENATAKIKLAAADITDTARQEIRNGITDKLSSPETQAMIDQVLNDTLAEQVQAEVNNRIGAIEETVDRQFESAKTQLTARLKEFDAEIANLETLSATATARVAGMQASFEGARTQTIESSKLLLPVDITRVEAKAGPDQLDRMLGRGVDALSYQLNGHYYGPMVWRYFDTLKALPQFRYVLILSPRGEKLIGILDAATLAAHLDPANTVALGGRLGADLSKYPEEEEVPGWNDFARWLNDGKLDSLRALPSYRPAGEPVGRDDSSLQVLIAMEQRRADVLPVVDENGRFAGIVDRSRLTARVLLEIAAPRN